MRGYKAFNCDLTCRRLRYKIGETYTLDDPDSLEICESGFHFCPDIAKCYKYYPANEATRICEVEALGEIQKSDEGDKMATDKIKILREITGPEKHGNLTPQEGYCNTGNRNSGNCNTGNHNSGDRNSGARNTGNWNSGNRNSGNWNTGNYNSGDRNSGNWNPGACNTGNYNSGDCNSGDRNSGDWNPGNYNSGDFNAGNFNTGCFNTHRDPTIEMFNKPTSWTATDWGDSYAREIMLGLYEDTENKQFKWDSLSEEDKETVMSLPNFDAEIFEECTGIRVE